MVAGNHFECCVHFIQRFDVPDVFDGVSNEEFAMYIFRATREFAVFISKPHRVSEFRLNTLQSHLDGRVLENGTEIRMGVKSSGINRLTRTLRTSRP